MTFFLQPSIQLALILFNDPINAGVFHFLIEGCQRCVHVGQHAAFQGGQIQGNNGIDSSDFAGNAFPIENIAQT